MENLALRSGNNGEASVAILYRRTSASSNGTHCSTNLRVHEIVTGMLRINSRPPMTIYADRGALTLGRAGSDAFIPVPAAATCPRQIVEADGVTGDLGSRVDFLHTGRADWELPSLGGAQQIVRADASLAMRAEGARRMRLWLASPALVEALGEPALDAGPPRRRCLWIARLVGIRGSTAASNAAESRAQPEGAKPISPRCAHSGHTLGHSFQCGV